MIIYINGCSHSRHKDNDATKSISYLLANRFNIPLISTTSISQWIMPKSLLKIFNNIIKNKKFVWNAANDGKSNDAIYFESMNNIQKLIDSNKKPDIVYIQWSGPSRRLVSTFGDYDKNYVDETDYDVNIVSCNPSDYNEYIPHLEPLGSFYTLNFIYSMQEFLKKNNVKYVFICYMELSNEIKNQYIFNKLDLSKFVTFNDTDYFYNGWINKMKNIPTAIIDKAGHPSLLGKKYMEHRILRKLQDLYNIEYEDYNKKFFNVI